MHFTREGRPVRILRPVGAEWLILNGQIGQMANKWSQRKDLLAYIGADGGRGEAAAIYDPISGEVEINTVAAFGPEVQPSSIGDFTERATHFEWPKATGAILHEAMHAMYTTLDMCKSHTVLDPASNHWFDMLDESRIERNGVLLYPDHREFLRACALGIVLKDTLTNLEKMTRSGAAAQLACLSLARVDGGVLEKSDTKEMRKKVLEILSVDTLKKMRKLWKEFHRLLAPDDLERMYEIAREFAKLVEEEAKKNGEPENEGGILIIIGGSGGDGSGEPISFEDILDAINNDRIRTEFGAKGEIAHQQAKEQAEEKAQQKREQEAEQQKNDAIAKQTFSITDSRSAGTGNTTNSHFAGARDPYPEERAVSNQIAQMLKKAKYRDRMVRVRDSDLPPGRLNTAAAIQGVAAKKQGGSLYVEPWRDKQRFHVEDPNLTVGIMCDISGSMGYAMEPIAVSAWVMSNAVARMQGTAASVYYGNSIFSVLNPGERLKQVNLYTANDGREEFDKAFRALDGGLNLLNGRGARLLIICSDGQYGGAGQMAAAIKHLKACREKGVAVVWLDYKNASDARSICEATGATRVVTGTRVVDAALAIGQACKSALEKASR